ncbi:hypothetical protein A5733_09475 [Mycobacterium sp. NS-7484]|uniref:DUF937 domain-containing protein n=1 Tax=unclassified Mycobacterium TaxID=2642494 RepID=UPI0007FF6724|nr:MULTISPECIES: DUF937 domain-containing protein [unclassified Mycobacterium]OBG87562.1 hypothetical protein A5699_02245 [Mycobacterium sp. E802]OMB97633.1 hypothetical protein A5733_09475 [Mycobacterium sp. NS-7484]
MAGLDDLFAQIPVADIANKLGADEGEVSAAIKTLVPALVGGVAENVQADNIDSSDLESAVTAQGASGLLDGGVSVDQVDANEGNQIVSKIFGGNDSTQVASALSGAGAGGSNLIKQLLPILAPIVLAYIGKQFAQNNAPAQSAPQPQASSGGLGDILGSILGGAAGGGGGSNNPLGSILGSVLGGGGGQGNAIGEILGGLLGGKK